MKDRVNSAEPHFVVVPVHGIVRNADRKEKLRQLPNTGNANVLEMSERLEALMSVKIAALSTLSKMDCKNIVKSVLL